MNPIKRFLISCLASTIFMFPAGGLVINEFMASNAAYMSDGDGDYEDWIELYNPGEETIYLAGYYLSDDEDNPFKWQFPAGNENVAPHLYYLIWTSGKDTSDRENMVHTNFSISVKGEVLLLSAPDGTLVDMVSPVQLAQDISYGRYGDSEDTWMFFKEPTPWGANITQAYNGIVSPPRFSHESGFYTEGFSLELAHPDAGVTLYYTLDGSVPTPETGIRYEGPVRIDSRIGEPNTISMIPTMYYGDEEGNPTTCSPRGEVFKISVVRAGAYREGYLASSPESKTFLVDPEIQDRYPVPIVSLVTEAGNLFDDTIGIYVPGDLYENLFPEEPWPAHPANYHQRGDIWERPVHISLFEPGGKLGFAQDAGIRIHGAWTRWFPQKSLRLYARDLYGEDAFDYPLFGDAYTDTFKRFILRNAGCDFQRACLRDGLTQNLIVELGLDQSAYRPCVTFINGEYWGVYDIRERIDKYYLQYRHGVDPENVDLLKELGEVEEGDASHYDAMVAFITTHDMSQSENYEYVKTLMDIDNFIAYQAVQLYIGNKDWPNKNIYFWRLRTDGYVPNAPPGHDGRWRWVVWDTDDGFGLNEPYTFNSLARLAEDIPDFQWYPFRKLLENAEFRNGLVNSLADYMNTLFLPDVVTAQLVSMRDAREPMMEEHLARWNFPGAPASVPEWHEEVQVIMEYAGERSAYMRQHIQEFLGLTGTAALSIAPVPFNQGGIRINAVSLPDISAGWEGTYFQGIPVEIEAVPAPGYTFAGWSGLPEDTPACTEVILEDSLDVAPLFIEAETSSVIHYWSFNDGTSTPRYTAGGALLEAALGPSTEITYDDTQSFMGENARFGDEPGLHLRVNNPLGASLTFQLPTTGYDDIRFLYETRRSAKGAGIQQVYYSVDGGLYEWFATFVIYDADPVLHALDLGAIEGVADNPHFAVRIEFEQGAGGTEGNNRFDNVTLDGVAAGANQPPVLVSAISLQQGIEQGDEISIPLDVLFNDPEGDPISFEIVLDKTGIADAALEGNTLVLQPLLRGELLVTLLASDPYHPPVPTAFRMLVYPAACRMVDGDFSFGEWSPDAPDGVYPAHLLFLQSNTDDTLLDTPLEYAYHIPHDDYNEDDFATIGFPYNNTRRTRINGLNEEGISFINTGRGRDLGGALLAVDTTGIQDAVTLRWLCGTLLRNEREYAIRLQYRTGVSGPFLDITDEQGTALEYLAQADGHTQIFGPVVLPEDLLGAPYAQILWRYYLVSGDSGPRAQLRLDDIHLSAEGEVEAVCHPADVNLDWRLTMSETIPYLAGWQGGLHPMSYAIRAVYLWQKGEYYRYDSTAAPTLCWVLAAPVEGEG